MPDTKFSLPRLREHLRKWWIFYVVGLALICFLNNLVFTMTRPQVPEENTVRIMLLNVYAEQEATEARADELLSELQAQERPVELVQFESLLGTGDQYSDMVVVVKLASGYSDLFITDDAGFESLSIKGACLPLDDVVSADDSRAIRYTDEETGETYIAGIRVKLADPDLFHCEEAILIVSAGGTNPEDSLAAMDLLIDGGLN